MSWRGQANPVNGFGKALKLFSVGFIRKMYNSVVWRSLYATEGHDPYRGKL